MSHIIILEVIQLFELAPNCFFDEIKVGQCFINRYILPIYNRYLIGTYLILYLIDKFITVETWCYTFKKVITPIFITVLFWWLFYN